MKYFSRPAIVFFLSLHVFTGRVHAQEKKADDSVRQGVKTSSAQSTDSLSLMLQQFLSGDTSDTGSNSQKVANPLGRGQVVVIADPGIITLNDSLIAHPKPLKGYRIQIYFGSFDQAREARAEFIRAHSDQSCYIEQVTPSFSVRAGNFRNQEEAYSRLITLKPEYPSAIIVPDEIQPPALELE